MLRKKIVYCAAMSATKKQNKYQIILFINYIFQHLKILGIYLQGSLYRSTLLTLFKMVPGCRVRCARRIAKSQTSHKREMCCRLYVNVIINLLVIQTKIHIKYKQFYKPKVI